jgi:UDP-galactopyranose mutase
MKKYDVLVVGSGIYGFAYAFLMKQSGKRVLVIDKRRSSRYSGHQS